MNIDDALLEINKGERVALRSWNGEFFLEKFEGTIFSYELKTEPLRITSDCLTEKDLIGEILVDNKYTAAFEEPINIITAFSFLKSNYLNARARLIKQQSGFSHIHYDPIGCELVQKVVLRLHYLSITTAMLSSQEWIVLAK